MRPGLTPAHLSRYVVTAFICHQSLSHINLWPAFRLSAKCWPNPCAYPLLLFSLTKLFFSSVFCLLRPGLARLSLVHLIHDLLLTSASFHLLTSFHLKNLYCLKRVFLLPVDHYPQFPFTFPIITCLFFFLITGIYTLIFFLFFVLLHIHFPPLDDIFDDFCDFLSVSRDAGRVYFLHLMLILCFFHPHPPVSFNLRPVYFVCALII